MKRAFVGLIAALAVLHAQTPRPRVAIHTPPAAVTASAPHIPQPILANLEQTFDLRLQTMDAKDPIDILGGTRALYVEGFGTVFTTEISLIVTPGIFPMSPKITDEQKAAVRRRKLAHIPQLEEIMKGLMNMAARGQVALPDDQKITYAVRLRYLNYEDTTDLPSQIVMTADKKSATQGDVKTKVE
jgi:hypothetical protein